MNAKMSANKSESKTAMVFAMVDGIPIALPKKAKFICQDKRGCWFYCERRPRIKDGDWTPNKNPIQLSGKNGKLTSKVLITQVNAPWESTLQATIRRSQLPTQH